jgi:hypothetical protein
MQLRSPVLYPGFAANMGNTSENPVRSHYEHTLPEHGSEIVDKGKWQQSTERKEERPRRRRGDVFVREQERYKREHLQATAQTLGQLLIAAVQNPNDPLSQEAVQALGSFAQAVEKRKGISATSASKEYKAPTTFFLSWAKRYGAIPILSEGSGAGSATILDRERAQKAAELYHEAKQQRIQPRKLLDRMSSS